MRFVETKLAGVYVIDVDKMEDERGFFARTFCHDEFAVHGLRAAFVQCSISFNPRKGTLRGMHYQAPPHDEAKLVRCTQGAIFDVAVDLRRGSPSFRKWHGEVLSAANRRMLYVPEGCAHGLLTLQNDTEVYYQISEALDVESARGLRWDDPAFAIAWPDAVQVISERDRSWPDFRP